jgi:Fe-S-cluster containining protein
MGAEYAALVDKVSLFTEQAQARRAADLHCQKGCDSCCRVWLSVGPVEADSVRAGLAGLDEAQRARVRARGLRELAREQAGAVAAREQERDQNQEARCAMLEDDGGCAIYAQRPLVCRTQGHALRYPSGLIPEQALHARTRGGDVTWCPLNYRAAPPRPEDVLDAERVDQLLALVNHRHAARHDAEPLARFALSALAASDTNG